MTSWWLGSSIPTVALTRSKRGRFRPGTVCPDRRGVALVELVVAMLCLTLVLQLSASVHAKVRNAARYASERSTRLDAARAARVVLRRELGAGVEGRDWVAFPPDSVRLRAFRGTGWVCAGADLGRGVTVRWAGIRRPDPVKDSVLVMVEDGSWRAVDLISVSTAGSCLSPVMPPPTLQPLTSTPVPSESWVLEPEVEGPVLLRIFESGSYHFGGDALRYRRGASGRQPITDAALAGAGLIGHERSVALRTPAPSSAETPWAGYVASRR